MTSDEIIQIAELAMEYFTGFGLEDYEQQDFLDQYYNKYGVGPEEDDEWFDDTPTFFDEEYKEIG